MLNSRIPSWLGLLLVSILAFSWTWLFAKKTSYRDPGSRFFDPTRAYEQRYSQHRSSEATKYEETVKSWLNNAENAHKGGTIDKWPLGTRRKGEDPAVCAVFITTARPIGTQYIDGAIASTLHALTPAERRALDLRIYFSNLTPSDHPSYGSWVHNITDAQFTPHDLASPDLLLRLRSLSDLANLHSKSGLDYSLALQNCLDTSNAPYIAIFEGDVQLADSWFIRVLMALKEAESIVGGKRWLLMRLFNEERASGFGSRHPLGNNVPWIILGIDAAVAFSAWNFKRVGRLMGSRMGWITTNFVLVACAFTVPAFTILFFRTGKATVLPPAPGLRVENFGCCTQGMVYPRTEVAGLVDELRRRSEEEDYDVVINEYSWKDKGAPATGEGQWLEHLSLYPVMVQHVGFESLINPGREWDKQIWSMAYEDLKAEKLALEHEGMVKEIFGEGAWVDNRP